MVEELLEAVPVEHVIAVALESNDDIAALIVHNAESACILSASVFVVQCLVGFPRLLLSPLEVIRDPVGLGLALSPLHELRVVDAAEAVEEHDGEGLRDSHNEVKRSLGVIRRQLLVEVEADGLIEEAAYIDEKYREEHDELDSHQHRVRIERLLLPSPVEQQLGLGVTDGRGAQAIQEAQALTDDPGCEPDFLGEEK